MLFFDYTWDVYGSIGGCGNLKKAYIPEGVTSIGGYAFCHCSSLTEIILPDSIKTIEEFAFAFCSNLVSADLGDCVNEIGNYAFYRCEKLKNVDENFEVKQLDELTSVSAFLDEIKQDIHNMTEAEQEGFVSLRDFPPSPGSGCAACQFFKFCSKRGTFKAES